MPYCKSLTTYCTYLICSLSLVGYLCSCNHPIEEGLVNAQDPICHSNISLGNLEIFVGHKWQRMRPSFLNICLCGGKEFECQPSHPFKLLSRQGPQEVCCTAAIFPPKRRGVKQIMCID